MLTLVAALARYAIDLLGIVFLIIVVGFALRAVSDWLTEGDSVSIWSLVAVVVGLAGTAIVGTWLFGSTSLTSRVARPVNVPPHVVRTIDWLEARGWGQRVLLREGPRQLPGSPGQETGEGIEAVGDRAGVPQGRPVRPTLSLPRFDLPKRSQEPGPGEAEAAPVPSSRVGARDVAANDGRQAGASGGVETNTALTTATTVVGDSRVLHLTAFVQSAAGSPTPKGQVAFYRGSELLGVVALQSGPAGATATLSTRGVPPGRHRLVAEYTGNDTFRSSRSSVIHHTVKRP